MDGRRPSGGPRLWGRTERNSAADNDNQTDLGRKVASKSTFAPKSARRNDEGRPRIMPLPSGSNNIVPATARGGNGLFPDRAPIATKRPAPIERPVHISGQRRPLVAAKSTAYGADRGRPNPGANRPAHNQHPFAGSRYLNPGLPRGPAPNQARDTNNPHTSYHDRARSGVLIAAKAPGGLPQAPKIVRVAKSTNQPPHWHLREFAGRPTTPRKRITHDVGVRSASRMTASASRPSRREAVKHNAPPRRGNGPVLTVGPELTLQINGEKIYTAIGPQPVKGARKYQSAHKEGGHIIYNEGEISSDEIDELESSEESEKSDEPSEPSESDTEQNVNHIVPIMNPVIPPPPDLMNALGALTLASIHMQQTRRLPFLLRNLRKGFSHRCSLLGIPVSPRRIPIRPVDVIYNYASRIGDNEQVYTHHAHMSTWLCPVCKLHGSFMTRNALMKHLEWDHSELGVTWEHVYKLIINIPPTLIEDIEPLDRPLTPPHIHIEPEDGLKFQPMDELPREQDRATTESTVVASVQESVLSASPPPDQKQPSTRVFQAPPSPEEKPKLKFLAPSPSRASTVTSHDQSRSTTATLRPSRVRPSLPSRYPTPPPPSDPLGPSAQYPYLPEQSGLYSCRPGGPRLFDLLNTLPLEPFGVLSWFIIDKEEELFELDDVRDEDKVMQALWSRWIFLNLNKFVENYYQGMLAFIDEYWRMIHRAAGWAALRVWLLVFVVNRFVTGSEMARLLQHYESLTGMHERYTNDEGDGLWSEHLFSHK